MRNTKGNPLPEYAKLTKQSERNFTAQVIEYATLLHWRCAHFRPGQTSRQYINKRGEVKNVWVTPLQGQAKGFPDIVMVRDNRMICCELKSEKGKPSEEQFDWLQALGKTGAEVYIWKPSDWDSVEEILK